MAAPNRVTETWIRLGCVGRHAGRPVSQPRDACSPWRSSWRARRAPRPRKRRGWARQTLRDWVHRYNREGLAGLTDRHGDVGPKRFLSSEQEAEVATWVRRGPDLAEHGVVRWRRADLARAIEATFGVVLAERSISNVLRRLGFRRLVARPAIPATTQRHKRLSKQLRHPRRRSAARARPRQAAGAGGRRGPHRPTGRPDKGLGRTRLPPRRTAGPAISWAYLFGAICPARGLGAALVLPFANAEMMNLHLLEISATVARRARRSDHRRRRLAPDRR